ncbi:MAG: DNA repair protein MmcB-related protein, partial [Sulfitobacter sp.]|nr:DNA repair protein MmcB-related protein [Sulfitobacter sp.]
MGVMNNVSLLQPGQMLQRGVSRHLVGHGFACVEELVPARGLRVDVMAL